MHAVYVIDTDVNKHGDAEWIKTSLINKGALWFIGKMVYNSHNCVFINL